MIRQVLHAQLALTNSKRLGKAAKAEPADLMGGLKPSRRGQENPKRPNEDQPRED